MEKIIKQINIFLSKHHWCDFEIIQLKGNLIIGGRTSFDKKFDIIITFKNIFFYNACMNGKQIRVFLHFISLKRMNNILLMDTIPLNKDTG